MEPDLTGTRKSSAYSPTCWPFRVLHLLLSESAPFSQVSPWTVLFCFFFSMVSHCSPKPKFLKPFPCWGADLPGPDSDGTCFKCAVLSNQNLWVQIRERRKKRERQTGRLSPAYTLAPSIQVSIHSHRGEALGTEGRRRILLEGNVSREVGTGISRNSLLSLIAVL